MDPVEVPKKKLTQEERDGNRLFKKEVRRLGVDGFVRGQIKMAEDAKKDGLAKADAMMDENIGPWLHEVFPRVSFSHVPQERWDAIFGKKENAHG